MVTLARLADDRGAVWEWDQATHLVEVKILLVLKKDVRVVGGENLVRGFKKFAEDDIHPSAYLVVVCGARLDSGEG